MSEAVIVQRRSLNQGRGKTEEMKELPILFSAPMVRAILAGTKTMTRRLIKTDNAGFAFLGRHMFDPRIEPAMGHLR